MFVEIIHSARPTAATRVGFEIALWVKNHSDDVLLVSQEDGPIVGRRGTADCGRSSPGSRSEARRFASGWRAAVRRSKS